jgi:hypothetical protein
MANEETKTTTTTTAKMQTKTVAIDRRLWMEDGRFYISSTPYDGGRQSGFPERMDVTAEVVDIIRQQLQQPRPRYIVRINQEYLEMIYRQRCIYTDSEKQEFLHTIIEQIRQFVRGEGKSDTLAAFTFTGSDGREHKSFELEAVSEGDPLLAVVEDLHGREVQRVAIKDKETDTPASCHDCQHWQDGDDGPQCEYPDMPPCRE